MCACVGFKCFTDIASLKHAKPVCPKCFLAIRWPLRQSHAWETGESVDWTGLDCLRRLVAQVPAWHSRRWLGWVVWIQSGSDGWPDWWQAHAPRWPELEPCVDAGGDCHQAPEDDDHQSALIASEAAHRASGLTSVLGAHPTDALWLKLNSEHN